jgi:predicted permease
VIQDFRFALRQLRKTPGFTAIAVATLGVAMGVNSAIFAIVNDVMVRPVVPLRPSEVVSVFGAWKDAKRDYRPFSYREYQALRESDEVFADVAAVKVTQVGVGRDKDVQRSLAMLTSESFFTLAGTEPARGRFFSAAECRPDADIPVVVASHALWTRLGGRADFVGSTLMVNGRGYTVIGISQAGFRGLNALLAPEVWLPLGVYARLPPGPGEVKEVAARGPDGQGQPRFTLLARLRPRLGLEAARARLPVLAARLAAAAPAQPGRERDLQIQAPSRFSITTTPARETPIGLIGALLVAMAGVVLLIACLNLANMLLARGSARTREIAVRLALGAGRGRIVRQLLCEGLLLALAGGVVGLLIAGWSNDLLAHSLDRLFLTMGLSMALHFSPDARVLAGTFGLCLLATLVFGLGPALQASRAALVNELKQVPGEPARAGGSLRFFAPRHLLVMAQIALSLALLFSGGLFFRGALAASRVATGFDPAADVVTELDFTLGAGDEAAARRSLARVLARARELPGVKAAAVGTLLPYGNSNYSRRVVRPDRAAPPRTASSLPDASVSALYTAITPAYFEAIGVGLLRGRAFTAREAEDREAPRVAIIDETLAAALFPDGEALGKPLRLTRRPTDGSPADMEVVGIVKAHRHDVLSGALPRRLFVPLAQSYSGDVFLHVRLHAGDRAAAAAFLPALRQALRALDPTLPVLRMMPFTDFIGASVELWIVRLGAVLFGVFGAVALLLAAVGVYGVKSYAVARRTREIGIRVALGAHPRQVFSLIMKQGAQQTAVALAAGSLLALGTGRVLAGVLYQVSPADPLVLLVAGAVLVLAALLACFLPARRATRVSPLSALRSE